MQQSDSIQTFQKNFRTNRTGNFNQEKHYMQIMEKKLAELEEEKRMLEAKIQKLIQREKTSIFLLQSQIDDLKKQNQAYCKVIDSLDKENRIKKGSSVGQSNLNKSVIRSSRKNIRTSIDKQNINYLNKDQNEQQTEKKNNEQTQIICQRIFDSLQSLLNSIKIRVINTWHIEEYEYWAKQLEQQRLNRKKEYTNKSSLALLKKIQQKIDSIQHFFSSGSDNDYRQVVSDRLAKSIKNLRIKMNSITEVPFLEKIDIEDRKSSYECLKTDARAKRDSILSMIRSK